MTLHTVSGSEWVASDEAPEVQGDFIRGLLVLGRESKNAWNASVNNPGDAKGPRRKFNVLLSAQEEIAKFAEKPAYMLHRPSPRDQADHIGTFANPRVSDKGLRMDLQLLRGAEGLHPQAAALKDNIERRRPFGGFSPRFDFNIDPTTGEVQTIVAVESIDLVPQPASVRSALESEPEPEPCPEPKEPTPPDEIAGIKARLVACESFIAGFSTAKGHESHVKSVPIPEPAKPFPASGNYRDFIRT